MAILISTNMFHLGELEIIALYLNAYDSVGVEVFPRFHLKAYEEELKSLMPLLQDRPVTFHGPYYEAEHSAGKGSKAYAKTMELVKKTIEYSRLLHAGYFVFHHNNCAVTEDKKEEMIRISCENYREIASVLSPFAIPVVVENAGVISRKNMLFDMDEFIDLCRKENYKVLIDIGHANANGWDISRVIRELKESVVAYHLHNNDGIHDSHRRIYEGTIDFDSFIREAKELTPRADWVIEYSPDVSADEEGIRNDIEELIRETAYFA